ncbi:hypothetical protein MNBD_ALPHA12-658 [hydrothermal vent metagenome]|uniref:Flagellin N-terminal domain-containing protein n=1 Tax=hydrothermal vent metagenome TaxID=652676 RepID=A0A3B0TZH9_9ZZZZ
MIINKNMFSVNASYANVLRMRQQMDSLQIQLATGKKAQTLSDMGPNRAVGIDLRQQVSRIDAYQNNITMVGVRLDVVDLALTRMGDIASEARKFAATDTVGENKINLVTAQNYSSSQLDEVINLLNSKAAGRYLLAGSDTDDPPVASFDAMMNGEGAKAGFRTIVSERKAADAGANGMGRIGVALAGATLTLSEDGVHPFGLKMGAVSSESTAVSATQPAGSPAAMGLTFTAVPNEGEKTFVTFTLPDGTSSTISLTATSTTTPKEDEYTLGADAATTAQNFETALNSAISSLAGGELASASVFAAADNFFNGNGDTVQRVDGPPFDSATSLIAGTPSNSVAWYDGSSSASARKSVSARVGQSASVNYGVEGNEKGFLDLVKSLAAMAVETFPNTDATSEKRYGALVERQTALLAQSNNNSSGSLEVITMELGIVRNTMGNYLDRNNNYKVQAQTVISQLEDAPVSDVVMKIKNLDLRLQASYQVMSVISKLTMVNYIR